MNINGIIYLAIPYTFNPEISFKIANEVAADLMKDGYIVFSPISHSHPISINLDEKLRCDHDFWMKQDLPILKLCSKVIMIVPNGVQKLIQQSRGCVMEIQTATHYNIPIEYLNCYYK